MSYKEQIDLQRLPAHIAIIMDGNGRWAKKQGKNRIFGHHKGVETVRKITDAGAQLGVKYLTLYAFSTENWGRPSFEVNALMELLVHTIRKETKQLNKNNICLKAIGNLEMLPPKCLRELKDAMELTKNNNRMTLTLALSYSARWEITEAVKQICQKVSSGQLNIAEVNEQLVAQNLSTAYMPDPELLIRTSGEQRISNYLLWQIAYSELFFTEKFWPEFDEEEFYKAICIFQQRERRFGKLNTTEQ
ncbi:isoprenyl transferase [Sphingobacteriales bacterium UPWRP_1]|nr:isoprenyl transferase [Sphingobacteriales bacterium TSM_CSS]PSJ75998.1 isoprenyl transferase [Sphingobacteriales bacterium UPWRP_1]